MASPLRMGSPGIAWRFAVLGGGTAGLALSPAVPAGSAGLARGLLVVGLSLWRLIGRREALVDVAGFFVVVLALEVGAQLLRGVNLGQHHITGYNLATLIHRIVYLLVVASLSVTVGLRLSRVLLAWTTASLLSVVLHD